MNKLSTQPYKGARDFYPEDKKLQNYIFGVMRRVAENFGYDEYDAPILEDTALYAAKSGEEIVNEQTYSFTDRGGRNITIRPEMTPTLARMVADKRKELVFPIRWYSIPNLWRYEKPQRGRLREHWQLNVDIYGISSVAADFEIISVAAQIMEAYGATSDMFTIRINNRRLMEALFYDFLKVSQATAYRLSKVIDRKEKVIPKEFERQVKEFLNGAQTEELIRFLELKDVSELSSFSSELAESKGAREISELFMLIEQSPLKSYARFDPIIIRGFDYYTGTVFEVFDTHPSNNRSLFGGGRYDNLLSIFGVPDLSGVGFGMGDLTIRDFIEVHGLLPVLTDQRTVYATVFSPELRLETYSIVLKLRESGIRVVFESEDIKLDKQLKFANRRGIPYVLIYGPEEKEAQVIVLKNLASGEQEKVSLTRLAVTLQKLLF